MSRFRLDNAELNWRDEQPESTLFGDIYFSVEDGIAETQHVFINSNQLPARLADLLPTSRFTIGETGFGTGLNFLCARDLWLRDAPKGARLQFISCERFPLALEDLKRALHRFSNNAEFASGTAQLIEQWPAAFKGFHKLHFDQGRIELWLLFGDAAEQLSQLDRPVDAWFLDGFAPSKNPEMWSPELFQQLGRLSHTETTFATFTSAGVVKRGLAEQGFSIQKVAGFGRKREMICGNMDAPRTLDTFEQPWHQRPPHRKPTRIAVIGAGLAGATTAYRLASEGIVVDLFEREAEPAQGGSGNPQGALYAKLPAKPTPAGRFHTLGLQFTINWLKALGLNNGKEADLCGLLQLAVDDGERVRQQEFIDQNQYPADLVHAIDADEASRLLGTATPHPALHFPNAGWASPPKLVEKLLQHPLIHSHFGTEIQSIQKVEDGWLLNGSEAVFSHVIFTTAYEMEPIEELCKVSLKPIRGQTTWTDAPKESPLNKVVCGAGYISPALNGQYCFGASFTPGDRSRDIREDEHQHNLALLKSVLPSLHQQLETLPRTGRVAQRAGSRDYLPLIGTLCDSYRMSELYSGLKTNAKAQFSGEAPWLTGLMINTGHGSKGLVSCPIAAEILTAEILNQPYPLEYELIRILSPQRFMIRDLKRSKSE